MQVLRVLLFCITHTNRPWSIVLEIFVLLGIRIINESSIRHTILSNNSEKHAVFPVCREKRLSVMGKSNKPYFYFSDFHRISTNSVRISVVLGSNISNYEFGNVPLICIYVHNIPGNSTSAIFITFKHNSRLCVNCSEDSWSSGWPSTCP